MKQAANCRETETWRLGSWRVGRVWAVWAMIWRYHGLSLIMACVKSTSVMSQQARVTDQGRTAVDDKASALVASLAPCRS